MHIKLSCICNALYLLYLLYRRYNTLTLVRRTLNSGTLSGTILSLPLSLAGPHALGGTQKVASPVAGYPGGVACPPEISMTVETDSYIGGLSFLSFSHGIQTLKCQMKDMKNTGFDDSVYSVCMLCILYTLHTLHTYTLDILTS